MVSTWLQFKDGPPAARGETEFGSDSPGGKGRGLVQGLHVFSGVVLLHNERWSERKADVMTLICGNTFLFRETMFMYGLGRQV